MSKSDTRIFRDQRYPDQLVSLEQLKRRYIIYRILKYHDDKRELM